MLCLHKTHGHHTLLYALIFSHSILMSRFLFYFLLFCITILYIISRIKSKDYLHFNCSWQTSAMAFSSVLRCYIHVLMEAANHLALWKQQITWPVEWVLSTNEKWEFPETCALEGDTWNLYVPDSELHEGNTKYDDLYDLGIVEHRAWKCQERQRKLFSQLEHVPFHCTVTLENCPMSFCK